MTAIAQPAPIPLVLIIPQAAVESLPAAIAEGIRGCEAQYSRGNYYITVPAARQAAWREMEKNA